MAIDENALQAVIDKDAIRDLVLLYSRAIDRQDIDLLRDLYTEDATDSHGDSFDGPADKYCDFIAGSFPYMPYSGHHVCNHLIAVDGDEASGEVYAIAYHLIPTREGGQEEDFMAVRPIDNHRRFPHGKRRVPNRVGTHDFQLRRPFSGGGTLGQRDKDPSYAVCTQRLFQRGARA